MANPLRKHLYISPDLHAKIMSRAATQQPFPGVLEDLVNGYERQGFTVAQQAEKIEKLEEDNRRLRAEIKLAKDEKGILIRQLSMHEDTSSWKI